MFLFSIFIILGLYFSGLYLLAKDKFSPANLLITIWLVSIGIAQLRLSPYENIWTLDFWLIISLFLVLFYLTYRLVSQKFNLNIVISQNSETINIKLFSVLVVILTLASFLSNFYIYLKFGTVPLFSSLPDKMRFIINKDIFGLWEYLALLPRLYIPLLVYYLLAVKNISARYKLFLLVNIILGFSFLFLYASRLLIILPILLAYFTYLYLQKNNINLKKVVIASVVVLLIVSTISVAIPAFRNYITYRDYYADDLDYTPFTYLTNLSGIDLPDKLNWIIPLYIIPSFNLQAMMQGTTYYNTTVNNFYGGGYYLSVFNPVLKMLHCPLSDVVIPWEPMYLSWWVTATFLFTAWADFGYLGIIFISLFWGVILASAYNFVSKKPTYLSIMLMSYLSFVVVMSIYTDYLTRVEFYLDIFFILIVGLIFKHFNRALEVFILA